MGLAKCSNRLSTNTVRMMLTGMCQVMTRFHSMKPRPTSSASAHTSPMVPAPKPLLRFPSSMSIESGNRSNTEVSPVLMACFMSAKGVAPVVASV